MFIRLHNTFDTVGDGTDLFSDRRMGNILICFPQLNLAAFVAQMLLAGSLLSFNGLLCMQGCRCHDRITSGSAANNRYDFCSTLAS